MKNLILILGLIVTIILSTIVSINLGGGYDWIIGYTTGVLVVYALNYFTGDNKLTFTFTWHGFKGDKNKDDN